MSSIDAATVPAGFRDATGTSIRDRASVRTRSGFHRALDLRGLASLSLAALGCNENRPEPSASRDPGQPSTLAGASGFASAGMNAAAGAPPSAAGSAGNAAITTASLLDPTSPLVRTPACSELGWDFAPGFLLAQSVDYVADILDSGNSRVVYSESGVPCATAHDRASCQASLAALTGFGRQLVTTSGEEVHFWTVPAALDLLGQIDTPAEVLWVLGVTNHSLPCGSTKLAAVADGWAVELPAQPPECGLASEVGWMMTIEMDFAGHVMIIDPDKACGDSYVAPPI
jgi:hypothetical protein